MIEIVWRQVRHKRFSSESSAKAFMRKLSGEEVEVFEVSGDTTKAWYDYGYNHKRPKKFTRHEMDG